MNQEVKTTPAIDTDRAKPNGYEQMILREIPEHAKKFELAFLRTRKRLKWDGWKAASSKEAFRHGWNCCVAFAAKADEMVLTDEEIASIKASGVIK